jgi:hypothetical protein
MESSIFFMKIRSRFCTSLDFGVAITSTSFCSMSSYFLNQLHCTTSSASSKQKYLKPRGMRGQSAKRLKSWPRDSRNDFRKGIVRVKLSIFVSRVISMKQSIHLLLPEGMETKVESNDSPQNFFQLVRAG